MLLRVDGVVIVVVEDLAAAATPEGWLKRHIAQPLHPVIGVKPSTEH